MNWDETDQIIAACGNGQRLYWINPYAKRVGGLASVWWHLALCEDVTLPDSRSAYLPTLEAAKHTAEQWERTYAARESQARGRKRPR